ncbi:outer membrane protein assembly factor BamE [Gallaecimonas xiamenensis]|uniref:Outer membrane protein assembly factor BamE n=1 Tax=Gallaecimonas xiamenensis 3-C-1 TaxID=745411 RepID=K2JFQ7_9GAMM|nr:outer membrane protein assembly factor BamE [Gallaecimonas xiamenensis]EKE73998.1 Small protein A [Gallaecimonas xiamenensis 3-C-1]
MKKALLALTLGLSLSGCGLIYRIDVPQGNYLEQDQIDKLQPGMSQEQVAYVLGTPLLKDSFNDGTWYYKYAYRPGKGTLVEKDLTLTFDGQGKLKAVKADDFDLPASLGGKKAQKAD